jgi:ribosome-binding factor A
MRQAVHKKPLWERLPALHPEDIAIERAAAPIPTSGRAGQRQRKQHQLCRQAQIAVEDALASDPDEPLLLELWVEAVEPAPDQRRLRVLLRAPDALQDQMDAVQEALDAVGPTLRREVSAQINRRRAPDLIFTLLAPGEQRHTLPRPGLPPGPPPP